MKKATKEQLQGMLSELNMLRKHLNDIPDGFSSVSLNSIHVYINIRQDVVTEHLAQ
jgi:hypothetical protein